MTRTQRKSIRKSLGLSSFERTPRVVIIPGIAIAPQIVGNRYWKTHFTRHYRSGKTFSHTLYTPSTRRTEVGELWLAPVAA